MAKTGEKFPLSCVYDPKITKLQFRSGIPQYRFAEHGAQLIAIREAVAQSSGTLRQGVVCCNTF